MASSRSVFVVVVAVFILLLPLSLGLVESRHAAETHLSTMDRSVTSAIGIMTVGQHVRSGVRIHRGRICARGRVARAARAAAACRRARPGTTMRAPATPP